MGQKVHPTGFRTGPIYDWKSKWFMAPRQYSEIVLEDHKVRKYLLKKLESAGVVQVIIERSLTVIKISLHVSRPGVVIGKGGANLEEVKKFVEQLINQGRQKRDIRKVDLRVEEVSNPDLSAKLVAERIVQQLVKRFPHRRAVSQALEKVMQAGALGVKIVLSGRIGGAEIGRSEKYFQGSVPTQTLRADIDYAEIPAPTRSGYVGIKVWINRGEIV